MAGRSEGAPATLGSGGAKNTGRVGRSTVAERTGASGKIGGTSVGEG